MVMAIMLLFLFLPIFISVGIMRSIQIIVVGFFGLLLIVFIPIAIFVGVFIIYPWLFPSLEERLVTAINEKCAWQETCKVRLHEITPFKWDKAYFFRSGYVYNNQNALKFTGISGDLKRDDTLVVFTKKDRLVKYFFLDSLDSFGFFDDSFKGEPPKDQYFDIAFYIDNDVLNKIGYSGDTKEFGGHTNIDYYELSLENDLLYIPSFHQSRPFHGEWAIYSIRFTNPTQLRWFDSNQDKHE